MIGHLFYLRNSYNFLFNIQLKIFSQTQLNLILTQLKIFSHMTEFFLTQLNFFLTHN